MSHISEISHCFLTWVKKSSLTEPYQALSINIILRSLFIHSNMSMISTKGIENCFSVTLARASFFMFCLFVKAEGKKNWQSGQEYGIWSQQGLEVPLYNLEAYDSGQNYLFASQSSVVIILKGYLQNYRAVLNIKLCNINIQHDIWQIASSYSMSFIMIMTNIYSLDSINWVTTCSMIGIKWWGKQKYSVHWAIIVKDKQQKPRKFTSYKKKLRKK